MQKMALGTSDLAVSRIGYGCMLIGGSWDNSPPSEDIKKNAETILHTAVDLGINFFDHADIYCRGKSEQVFSDYIKKHPDLRKKIYLQSKCGILLGNNGMYDFSYKHIIKSAEGSLRRLGTDTLDVYLLHRPDPLVEPEEVAKAFDELMASGKVRWFGVSNHTSGQIVLLKKYLSVPIVTNQVEFNPIHTHLLDAGINFNQNNPLLARNADTLEFCRVADITIQAWSPLAQGFLSGRTEPSQARNVKACAKVIAEIAEEKNVSSAAVVLAWTLRHPAKIQPIPGVTNAERLIAACQADSIELSREEWYRIFIAGRGEELP